MAALTSTSLTLAGVVPAPVAVSASDTVAATQCGPTGILLRVINGGGSPDVVTIVDPNTTVVGSAATSPTKSVTNGTTQMFRIPNAMQNASGLITIQHSFITTVTCEVWQV